MKYAISAALIMVLLCQPSSMLGQSRVTSGFQETIQNGDSPSLYVAIENLATIWKADSVQAKIRLLELDRQIAALESAEERVRARLELGYLLLKEKRYAELNERLALVHEDLKGVPSGNWRSRFWELSAQARIKKRDLVQGRAFLDSAIRVMDTSEPMFEAVLRRDLGRYYYEDGEYQTAMMHFVESQKVFEENNIRNAAYAHLLHYIGSVFKRQNNDAQAIVYYEEMLALARQLGDIGIECEALDLCSDVYNFMGQPDKGLEYLLKALELSKRLDDCVLRIQINLNIGHQYYYQEAFAKAIFHLEEAERISNEECGGEHPMAVYAQRMLGNIYSRMGKHDKAIPQLEKALAMAQESKSKRTLNLSEAYNSLAFAHRRKGDYERAFDYLLDHMDYKDSLINEENVNVIHDLEKKYESEKKEAEIELLSLDKAMSDQALERQRFVKNLFIIGFLMVLLIAFTIFYGFTQVRKKNAQIFRQKELVESKNYALMESIAYARKLQEAVLPPAKVIKEFFSESFLLYLPRDIVSGDFYWMESRSGISYFAVGDCTGHGVPGAMLSVMGLNGLNRALNELEITRPADFLRQVTKDLHGAFERSDATVRDGMDLAICALDPKKRKLVFAGANNPLWIARNGEMLVFRPNMRPVGFHDMEGEGFTEVEVNLQEGDIIYLMSDGYADQLGGPSGLKMMTKVFRKRLLELSRLPMAQQREELLSDLKSWQDALPQTDDICVIGMKVT